MNVWKYSGVPMGCSKGELEKPGGHGPHAELGPPYFSSQDEMFFGECNWTSGMKFY